MINNKTIMIMSIGLFSLALLYGVNALGIGLLGVADDPGIDSAALKPNKHIASSTAVIADKAGNPFKEASAEHPMAIESLRQLGYPGGDFEIKQALNNGANYRRYVASYLSEGLEINGLLTVPLADKPEGGYPAVVFVHGYIPPDVYSTVGSYPTYQAALARAGFITYKPDLRGHDQSEGEPVSAHFSEKYVIDTMNAIAYLRDYEDSDPGRLGYWGHSNGGEIGLRVLAISREIRAASFWAGVVGSYEDMLETYNEDIPFLRDADNEMIRTYGLPGENPGFWQKLDPHYYLSDISAPVQLQHATGDESVPVELSLSLKQALEEAGKSVDYIEYQGDDHNIGLNSGLAWQRTIDFFNTHLAPRENDIALPLDRPEERVSLKNFGDYITPDNSPIENERFRGYHTGIDWEILSEEQEDEVEVRALCPGRLVYKNWVSGYGGLAIQECTLGAKAATVLYGHLDIGTIDIGVGESAAAGETVGLLGQGNSRETDFERKHLHLGIHRGREIELAGYVSSPDRLDEWLDPMQFIPRR